MRKTKTTRYDVAEHLRTPEEMAAYLEACLDEAKGDAAFIAKALGDIARARGMGQVARDAGLSGVDPVSWTLQIARKCGRSVPWPSESGGRSRRSSRQRRCG
jgi:hypothetical protein